MGFKISSPRQAKELNSAAWLGDVRRVEELLQRPQDPNLAPDEAPDWSNNQLTQEMEENGTLPLLLAAGEGHVEVVRLLLEAAASPNKFCDYADAAPIHQAACEGHFEILLLLLGAQADLNAASYAVGTALCGACGFAGSGDLGAIKLLLDSRAELNCQRAESDFESWPIVDASGAGHVDVVRFLLEKEASAAGDFSEAHGQALLAASRQSGAAGRLAILRLLLNARAGTEAVKDWERQTPLAGPPSMATLTWSACFSKQGPTEISRAGKEGLANSLGRAAIWTSRGCWRNRRRAPMLATPNEKTGAQRLRE